MEFLKSLNPFKSSTPTIDPNVVNLLKRFQESVQREEQNPKWNSKLYYLHTGLYSELGTLPIHDICKEDKSEELSLIISEIRELTAKVLKGIEEGKTEKQTIKEILSEKQEKACIYKDLNVETKRNSIYEGYSPIHFAAINRYSTKCLDMLLDLAKSQYFLQREQQKLQKMCNNGNTQEKNNTISSLQAKYVPFNANRMNFHQQNAFLLACKDSCMKSLAKVCNSWPLIDVDVEDRFGWNGLMYLAHSGNQRGITFLSNVMAKFNGINSKDYRRYDKQRTMNDPQEKQLEKQRRKRKEETLIGKLLVETNLQFLHWEHTDSDGNNILHHIVKVNQQYLFQYNYPLDIEAYSCFYDVLKMLPTQAIASKLLHQRNSRNDTPYGLLFSPVADLFVWIIEHFDSVRTGDLADFTWMSLLRAPMNEEERASFIGEFLLIPGSEVKDDPNRFDLIPSELMSILDNVWAFFKYQKLVNTSKCVIVKTDKVPDIKKFNQESLDYKELLANEMDKQQQDDHMQKKLGEGFSKEDCPVMKQHRNESIPQQEDKRSLIVKFILAVSDTFGVVGALVILFLAIVL